MTIIWLVVLYFPNFPAGITSPLAAANILIPLIKNSLAITTIDIQEGIYPKSTNITKAEITRTLSASGSIIFPKSVIKLCFLAKYPSKKSVSEAITNITKAIAL